jgi:hypothetical protein
MSRRNIEIPPTGWAIQLSALTLSTPAVVEVRCPLHNLPKASIRHAGYEAELVLAPMTGRLLDRVDVYKLLQLFTYVNVSKLIAIV